jgi:hypothetical protein
MDKWKAGISPRLLYVKCMSDGGAKCGAFSPRLLQPCCQVVILSGLQKRPRTRRKNEMRIETMLEKLKAIEEKYESLRRGWNRPTFIPIPPPTAAWPGAEGDRARGGGVPQIRTRQAGCREARDS